MLQVHVVCVIVLHDVGDKTMTVHLEHTHLKILSLNSHCQEADYSPTFSELSVTCWQLVPV